MQYEDKIITCVEPECKSPNREFIFTAGSQEFFAGKGFPLPKRCKECRDAKKLGQETRKNSPFRKVADQLRDKEQFPSELDNGYRPNEYRGKKHQNHRRTGRERMDDFEGQN